MKKRNIVLIFVSLIALGFGHEDDMHTIKYSTENFSTELPKKSHFVMFYAPWCGHCQRLGPTWEQLAEMLNEDESNIRIAKVDCTTDSQICSEQDITGYPTLKFFKIGDNEGVKFRGTRDLPTLTNFINEQLREGDEYAEIKTPLPVSGLHELTEDNFEKHIAEGKHFIKFYAPWCGHCQKLAPVWEQVAKSLEFEKDVTIGKIDCTQYRSICNQFEVKGYPTLLWIEDGKKVEKYQGERNHEDLKSYINKMLGSSEITSAEGKQQAAESEGLVGVLNGDTFNHGIEKGVTFVKFFAPWCGHCKRLAPTWEDLGKKFLATNGVNIVKVDCTLDINKNLCNDQEVEGFPTIFLYKNGQKMSEYSGSRSLDDLYDFVKSHVGHDEL